MSYQIIDANAEPIKASANFQYKDFTISFSTIFKVCTVLVYSDDKTDFNDIECNTVEAAILLIDDYHYRSTEYHVEM